MGLAVVLAAALWSGSAAQPVLAQQLGVDELHARMNRLVRESRYGEALKAAEDLASAVKAQSGEMQANYASALSWMAYIHQLEGRPAAAQPLLERALEIYEKVLEPGHPMIATTLNNLGFQYQSMGRYEEAERYYKRSLELHERVGWPSPAEIANVLNNLGQVYKMMGRLSEAEPLLRRAIEMRRKGLGPEDPMVAHGLLLLAGLLELKLEFVEAEQLLRQALEIQVKKQPPGHPDIALTTTKLAQNLFKQGKYVEAEKLFRSALADRRKTLSPTHIGLASDLFDLAQNQIEQGKHEEAERLLREALSIQRAALPPTHPDLARTYMELGEALFRQGKYDAAFASVSDGTSVRLARPGTDELSRVHFLKHVKFAWHAVANNPGRAAAILDETLTVAQWAAQTDTATAVQRMAARFASSDAKLQDMVRQRETVEGELQILDQQLSAALALPDDRRVAASDQARARLADANSRLGTIDRELKQRFPGYFALVRPEPLKVPEIAELLAADEALVDILSSYDETYVFVVTRSGSHWYSTGWSPNQFVDAVQALRTRLDVEDLKQGIRQIPSLFDLGLAHEIYTKVLGPAEDLIRDKAHLIIVPSGPLTALPFHVLVTEPPAVEHPVLSQLAIFRDVKWLVNKYAISVLPAVSSLKGLRAVATSPQNQKPLIGFGNPRFVTAAADRRSRSRGREVQQVASRTRGITSYWRGGEVNAEALRQLPALPETETELRAVARKVGADARDLLLGVQATESAVKRLDLTSYRIVYFATHGLISGEVKGLAEPALALTPPDTPSANDDGLLTASEIAQLRMNADWVVLAACNTAAGDAPGADALSGLARAFFHAGARALLVSHWRVGSEAAAKLTTATFEAKRLDPSLGRAEALRRAMIGYMADTSDPWSGYPAFWAPFTVAGEGGK
jgi:CHAT domain-containing protein